MKQRAALLPLALVTAALVTGSDAFAARTVGHARESEARARAVVTMFFESVESRRYRKACSLLGDKLQLEAGGAACPTFIRRGTPGALRWSVVRTRSLPNGAGVLVRLGQNELDHVRMRTWLAVVRPEHGRLRIVETLLLQ